MPLLQNREASLVAQPVKNPPAMWETWVRSLGWEDALEKGKATHSSILAWRIPGTVWSMGSQRVGHNWATFTFQSFKILEVGETGIKPRSCAQRGGRGDEVCQEGTAQWCTGASLQGSVLVTQSCLTLQPHGLYSPWNSPGQNTEVCSLYLL